MASRLTTGEAARLVKVSASTIRSWRHRNKLTPCSIDHDGNPLYWSTEVLAAASTRRPRAPA